MKKDQFVFFLKKAMPVDRAIHVFFSGASGNLVNTTFSTRCGREIGDR